MQSGLPLSAERLADCTNELILHQIVDGILDQRRCLHAELLASSSPATVESQSSARPNTGKHAHSSICAHSLLFLTDTQT